MSKCVAELAASQQLCCSSQRSGEGGDENMCAEGPRTLQTEWSVTSAWAGRYGSTMWLEEAATAGGLRFNESGKVLTRDRPGSRKDDGQSGQESDTD